MRVEPISLFGGGSRWSISSVSSVSPAVIARRLEARERREREETQQRYKLYKTSMTNLASRMNDMQVGNYNTDGSREFYDVVGAMFDRQA